MPDVEEQSSRRKSRLYSIRSHERLLCKCEVWEAENVKAAQCKVIHNSGASVKYGVFAQYQSHGSSDLGVKYGVFAY